MCSTVRAWIKGGRWQRTVGLSRTQAIVGYNRTQATLIHQPWFFGQDLKTSQQPWLCPSRESTPSVGGAGVRTGMHWQEKEEHLARTPLGGNSDWTSWGLSQPSTPGSRHCLCQQGAVLGVPPCSFGYCLGQVPRTMCIRTPKSHPVLQTRFCTLP